MPNGCMYAYILIQADIAIDWDNQRVYGKIDGDQFESKFHSIDPIQEVNGIMLYNLKAATTSYFSNILVKTEIPDGISLKAILISIVCILQYMVYMDIVMH